MKKIFMLSIIIIALLSLGFTGYYVYGKVAPQKPYTGELVGIKGTNVYHRSDCVFVKKASAASLVMFYTTDSAAKELYRPCKTCLPPDNSVALNKIILANREKAKLKDNSPWTADDFNDEGIKNKFLNGTLTNVLADYNIKNLIKKGLISEKEYNDTLEKYPDVYSDFGKYEDYK